MIIYKFCFLLNWIFFWNITSSISIYAKNERYICFDNLEINEPDSLIQLFNRATNHKTAAHHAFSIGEYYWFQRQINEAEKWFLISLKNESKPNNFNDVVNVTALLANVYHHSGEFEKAEDLANQAFENISNISNKKLLGNLYELKGRIYHSLGKSEMSLQYFLQADSANMKSHYPEIRKLSVYVKLIIADIFIGQGQKDKGKKYLDEAYNIAITCKDKTQINLTLQAISRWYISVGQHSEAKILYISLLKNEKRQSANLYTYQGLGEIYYGEKEYKPAINYFRQAVEIAKKTNELYMLDVFYYDIAKSYCAINELTKSKLYIDSCLNHKVGNLSNKIRAYELKSKICEIQNDLKGALKAIQSKNLIQDSLNRQNIATITNRLDAANRTKEKDIKIHALENEKQLIEKINLKNNIIKYLLFVSIGALTFIFFLIIKQLKKRKIEEQKLAIQNEQNRISADLHDDIGSTLSSISLYSELADKYFTTFPLKSREMVGKISEHSKDLMDKMGDIIWSLNIEQQQITDIQNRITTYAIELLRNKEILYHIDIDPDIDDIIISNTLAKNILLISKEAFHNISKYSQANEVHLSLYKEGNKIVLNISDNGIGFDPEIIKKGNGLENMKKRTLDLDGKFVIHTRPGKGVNVECNFPVS